VTETQTPRVILSLAPPQSYVSLARLKLSQAGYSVISEDRWEAHYANVRRAPDLVIVDAERAHELGGLPGILLYARGQSVPWAASAIGSIERPAGFHDLYRLVQAALEANPRATPRVATSIPARVRGVSSDAEAQVVSLSRGGCLLRRQNPPDPGEEIALEFDLPRCGTVQIVGRTVYRRASEAGLVFRNLSGPASQGIQSFVEERMLAE
jgi:PilZ domain